MNYIVFFALIGGFMKFIKFLSLITIISCAPALYSMEKDNTSQEQQSCVPKLADLCRQNRIEQINPIINQQYAKPNTYEEAVELLNNMNNQFSIATLGLADGLYNSSEIFQHCIDLIINEIWNQCQNVTGTTLDTIMHEIRQNLLSKIPSENLLSFIEAHFCKQKGWYVPYCLKAFNNVLFVYFAPNSSLMFIKYRDGRGELIDAKSGAVIKVFNNVNYAFFSPDSSLMFVRYQGGRGELINVQTGVVLKKFNGTDSVNFSPDSSLMFVRYQGGRGELINMQTGVVLKKFNNVLFVNFSPNSSLMFVRYQGGRGELINVQTGVVLNKFNDIARIDFAPNSLVVRYQDGRGELINVQTGVVLKKFNNVLFVNFSPNSSLMFVNYRDGRGELIDAKTGVVLKKFNNVLFVNFSPNSSLMFVRYRDGRGELIDAKSGAVLKKFNNVGSVIFSLDSSLMFVRYEDNRGELINVQTGVVLKKFNGTDIVDFSPDNSLMFVRYGDNRGELLCAGNFEQIIFKCALRNTLQMHKEQQSNEVDNFMGQLLEFVSKETNEVKQGLIALLKHQIFTTFPQQVQDRLSQEITDTLQDKDDAVFGSLEPPNKRQKIE